MKSNILFENSTVATFSTRADAERALTNIAQDGVRISTLSIVSTDPYTKERALRYYRKGERVLSWAGWAALWGAFWGLIFGPVFVHIPGYGNLPGIVHYPSGFGHFFTLHIVANPLAMLWGPAINAVLFAAFGALSAWLFSLSNPSKSPVKYETSYAPSRYLLVVEGSVDEIERARSILERKDAYVHA